MEDKNLSMNETLNDSNQEAQTSEQEDKIQDEVENSDAPNQYEQELKRLKDLEDENLRLKDEARRKGGALREARQRLKELEGDDSDTRDIVSEDSPKKALTAEDLQEYDLKRQVQEQIRSMSSDPAEAKLAWELYNSRLVKSGNSLEDAEAAIALANRHIVKDIKSKEVERMNADINFARGSHSNPQSNRSGMSKENDPVKNKAKELLNSIGAGDASKFL